jgi:hypothetical protein
MLSFFACSVNPLCMAGIISKQLLTTNSRAIKTQRRLIALSAVGVQTAGWTRSGTAFVLILHCERPAATLKLSLNSRAKFTGRRCVPGLRPCFGSRK